MMRNVLIVFIIAILIGGNAHAQTKRDFRAWKDWVLFCYSDNMNDSYLGVDLKKDKLVLKPAGSRKVIALQEISLHHIDTTVMQWQLVDGDYGQNYLLKLKAYPNKTLVVNHFQDGKKQKEDTVSLYMSPMISEEGRREFLERFKAVIRTY